MTDFHRDENVIQLWVVHMFRHNQFLTFGRTNPKTKSPWKETHQSLDAIIDPSEPIVDLATNLGGTANVEEPTLPVGRAPAIPQPLYQEQGSRYSRALPYELHVSAQGRAGGTIALKFRNTGKQGARNHPCVGTYQRPRLLARSLRIPQLYRE